MAGFRDATGAATETAPVIDANCLREGNDTTGPFTDRVAVEEPLQISVAWKASQAASPQERVFTITMRTPGDDLALALGLLHAEGLIRRPGDVASAGYVSEADGRRDNEVLVELSPGLEPDWQQYERFLTTQSSCGVCGKTSLQSIQLRQPPAADPDRNWLDQKRVCELGDSMLAKQALFAETGGVHAAGLFDERGELQLLREDVGRHNAMDKLIGSLLYDSTVPPPGKRLIAMLSGRLSFELVQKAVMARLPVLAGVGAPSSLAIKLATLYDLTLVGFASTDGFNVYSGQQRLLS